MTSLTASLWRQRAIAFVLPLLLSAPFLNRAFFVDDSYFVEIAEWLQENPLKPYDFTADDAAIGNRGWEKDGFVRMVNPLAHQYFLAAVNRVGHGRIWVLRLAAVLLTCLAAVFVFELARRWTEHPLLATALTAASPPYWLTAHSLLIDSTMGFFFVGALYFFIRSSETGSWTAGIASGLFIGLALLSKYTAAFIFPLTAVWFVLRWSKAPSRRPLIAAWIIGAAALAAYSAWTAHLYGRPHIIAASARMVGGFGWPKVVNLFVFLGGACLLPVAGWLGAGRRLVFWGACLGALLLAFFSPTVAGFPWSSAFLLALWSATAVVFLVRLALDVRVWIWPRDAFIAAWIFGFIAMMLVVMDWVAVRYFHIVTPAAAFAAVRIVERFSRRQASKILACATAALVAFTGFLAYADYRQAEAMRRIGPILEASGIQGGPRRFYLGDSFTMSYLRGFGWMPAFEHTRFQPGDLVLSKEVTMPLIWFHRLPVARRAVATFDFPTRFPIKVMDFHASAGFYASVWGALPFAFSSGPWERFRLFEITGRDER